MISTVIDLMERGLIPDFLIRIGIKCLCQQRIDSFRKLTPENQVEQANQYIENLKRGPIADSTDDANEQHYELPPEFFLQILGRHLKYSSGFWPAGCSSLDESERVALEETCARAELKNGQKILELGCGWGSLTLTMAAKFPNSQIVAISNSKPQRLFIEARAKALNLNNVQILTRNMLEVESLEKEFPLFDRVVSVEMFEHMKNYELLLERIARWVAPGGKLFVHIFTHREYSYLFETEGEDNWMGKYFFTGGQMPSHHLLSRFQKDFSLEKDWFWSGIHYSKTSEAWLANMDKNRDKIIPVLAEVYGSENIGLWFQRWRIFFMACAELFGYKNGQEWGVSHYRFVKRGSK